MTVALNWEEIEYLESAQKRGHFLSRDRPGHHFTAVMNRLQSLGLLTWYVSYQKTSLGHFETTAFLSDKGREALEHGRLEMNQSRERIDGYIKAALF